MARDNELRALLEKIADPLAYDVSGTGITRALKIIAEQRDDAKQALSVLAQHAPAANVEEAYSRIFSNNDPLDGFVPVVSLDTIVSMAGYHPDAAMQDVAIQLLVALRHNAVMQRFKDYVHKRLDDAGIPTHPEGEHSAHGCRIGDRLDIALQPQAGEWKPIDKHDLLEPGTLLVGNDGRNGGKPWVCEARYWQGHGWFEANNDPTDSWGGSLYVTHVRPLPTPPTTGDAGQGEGI